MTNSVRFPYMSQNRSSTETILPFLPITLVYKGVSVSSPALLDTGSTINVLPYSIGSQLGAVWEKQKTSVQLTGNLAQSDARGLVVSAVVGSLPPVRLVFAWIKTDNAPIILGQMNFFQSFEVCFFGEDKMIEIHPKT